MSLVLFAAIFVFDLVTVQHFLVGHPVLDLTKALVLGILKFSTRMRPATRIMSDLGADNCSQSGGDLLPRPLPNWWPIIPPINPPANVAPGSAE